MNPLVSVVVPVYNGEKYVAEAVASILSQSHSNLDIVLVDDGSTDASLGILKDFELRDSRVQVLQKSNGGLSSARNFGMRAAKGEYIAFLDADDIWLPHKIERQLNLLIQSKDAGLVYCDNIYIDSVGNEIDVGGFRLDPTIQGQVFSELVKANKVCGSGSGVLVPQSVFREVGEFDEKLRACEDWDMWLRISRKYSIKFVADVLVKIRIHPDQMQSSTDKMFLARLTMFLKHADSGFGSESFELKIKDSLTQSLTYKRYRLLIDSNGALAAKLLAIVGNNSKLFWLKALVSSYVSGFLRLVRRFSRRKLGV